MSERWLQHSRAVLSASVLVARVDPAAVRRRLERHGVSVWQGAEHSPGHPLIVELWRVQRGQIALGGVAFEDVCGVWGAAGRAAASACVDVWGSYHELLFSLPDVQLPGSSEPVQLVLGMYTDSALSKRGAEWLGYGYGKQLAAIERCGFATYKVRADASRGLSARFSPARERPQPLAAVSELAELRSWLAQPLLGVNGGARALSRLTRDYTTGASWIQPARGTLELDVAVLEDLLAGSQQLLGFARGAGLQGFHAPALPVQLSFPKAQRSAEWRA